MENDLDIQILEAIKLIASSTEAKVEYDVKHLSHKTGIFDKNVVNITHINIILKSI